jgi:Protein of unknown function (DUF998)
VSTTTLLAAAAALAVVVAAVLVIALHVLPTGLDPTRNAVSQYGRTRFAALYRAQVIASGASGLLLLIALVGAGVRRPLPLAALGAYALARLAIARNMMDLTDEAPTQAGRNHVLLALVAFFGLAIAAVPISNTLDTVASNGLSGILSAVAVAVPITAIVMFGAQGSLRARFGAFERLFYLAAFAWLFLASVSLAMNGAVPGA